ncbi:Ni/Co efflux regulator RcnB [Erwinia persicina]|uniref:RcnB family protein n=1 Tax=Erwinia plantamica TaxID=3237104 RepID=A0ABW7CJJ6_9GAMM|nr:MULTISPECIES: RcnB family protein [Erwinia]MCP1437793.1 Ni/Co efflux regulator RcnB [Erwinia persicina]MDN8541153.1 RcnB family protein [Erwinia sp. BC051422]
MKKSGAIALSALLFATSLSAFAEGPRQDGQPPVKHEQQHGNPSHGNSQPEQHRDPRHNAHPAERRQAAHPEFRKGRPLPEKYRGEGYQVNDWHKRGLKAPPAGHRWQNIDGNYVLIAIATGAIVSVIAHH